VEAVSAAAIFVRRMYETRGMRLAPLLLLAPVLTAGVSPAGARPAHSRRAAIVATVRVTAREFSFALSRKTVPVGTVRFVVTNAGAIGHDFVIVGRRTRVLGHAQRATLLVRFPRGGSYGYRCSVPGHAAVGMKGVLVVGKRHKSGAAPPVKPPPAQPPPTPTGVTLTKIGTFVRPIEATAPPGDEHRLFVVEQTGVVRVMVDGVLLDRPFLDISDLVYAESETGLLSLAFAPDYATSGRFYVYFNGHEGNHDVDVVEFRRSSDPNVADRDSYRLVLAIHKPWENHNAGMMEFGPDGYLYIAVGDGDSGVLNPPGAFAQTLDDLLGSILRIDPASQPNGAPYGIPPDNPFVAVAGARPEIWAYGLRNPWRFDINAANGDLYVGDVGEGTQEEIDVIPGGHGGENLGWPCFEGTAVFDASASCPNSVPPTLSYDHNKGCSVIGGVIARDPRLPQLDGRFVYGDLCSGAIRSMLYADGHVLDDASVGPFLGQVMAFGEDGLGRIYASSLADRSLYRLDPVTPSRRR
jgi:glucose/arabinose dehydrogenase